MTIRQVGVESYEMPDLPRKSDQFREELKKAIQDVEGRYTQLEEEIVSLVKRDKPLTKVEKTGLLSKATALSSFAKSTLPFMADQFQKHMEQSSSEARSEVESFVSSTVTRLGMESLGQLSLVARTER